MTDRAYEPANPDPFASFNPQADKIDYAPEPVTAPPKSTAAPAVPADPFANFDTQAKKVSYQTDADGTSATGSFLRSAARSVLPAVGSFPAMGAGAEIGAALGAPGGPLGMAVGGIAGALVGGIGSSMLIAQGQNYALSKMPNSWVEAIGQDDAQQKLDEAQHSKASFLGGLLPYALTMRPGSTPLMALPENATALQRIMASPTTSRIFGGGIQGGMELGNEALTDNPVEWSKVAIATGFGVVWNRPTRIGERLTEMGAHPARRVLGRPEPTAATPEPAPGETQPAPAAESVVPVAEPIPAEPKPVKYGVDLFTPPAEERPITVADAADLGVMGPGVTKSTFEGAHERDPSAVATAREAKRTEQSVIGPDPQADVHHTAQTLHPELFEHYAELKEQQKDFDNWFATHEGEVPPSPTHLAAINKEIAELEPQIAAAYRRAAESAGTHVVEPDVAANAEASKPTLAELFAETRERNRRNEEVATAVAENGQPTKMVHKDGRTALVGPDVSKEGMWRVTRFDNDGPIGHVEYATPKEAALGALKEGFQPIAESAPIAAETASAPAVTLPRTIEQQRDAIRQDVAAQLVAAGRPREEAQAAAALIAARYETRAAAFGGKRGTAEELYHADAAEILGPGARSQQTKGQPRAKPKYENLSAVQFIASRGGIKADDPLVGDVQSIFGTKNKFVPGFGQLIRKNGLPLDQMREALAEAGYFPSRGTTAEAMAGTKVNDLLDLLAAEGKGRRELKPGEEAPADAQREDHLNAIEQEIDAGLKDVGIDPAMLSDNVRARTLEIMDREGVRDPVQAYERAESELGIFQKDTLEAPKQDGTFESVDQSYPRATDKVSGLTIRKDVPNTNSIRASINGEYTELPGIREVKFSDFDGAKPVRDTRTEKLAAEIAESGEINPLIVVVDEKGPYILEGSHRFDALQINGHETFPAVVVVEDGASRAAQGFEQREQAEPFYSGVAKAIEGIPQEKAHASQWLATIKNRPGVKPEELEWLGLEQWLGEQKGSVTKQQIADYVKANQIEVKEVIKGIQPDAEAAGKALAESQGNSWDALSPVDQQRYIRTADGRRLTNYGSDPKFSQYTLPGGENYRELLLTLPEKTEPNGRFVVTDGTPAFNMAVNTRSEAQDIIRNLERHSSRPLKIIEDRQPSADNFKSSHFDEPNIIAHIRFNDRYMSADGTSYTPSKKTLFIEEIQSDWHQKGKREGYKQSNNIAERQKEIERQLDAMMDKAPTDIRHQSVNASEWAEKNFPEFKALRDELFENQKAEAAERKAVPDAPFKTTWPELALKRMIRYAAENGYEKVAWTPGEVQAARYDLSKHVKEIEYIKNSDGTYKLGVTDKNGEGINLPNGEKMSLTDIENTVGKEIAEKIAKEEGKKYRGHEGYTLDGLDLKVGGEGMKGFYDKILPAAANKLVKKFGGKVEQGSLRTPDNVNQDVPFTVRDRNDAVIETGIFDENFAAQRANEIGGSYALESTAGEKANTVHTLDINPELRAAATEQGFPLFQDPNAGALRGRIDVAKAEGLRRVIRLSKIANSSTFMHESAHDWLEHIVADANHPLAPDILKADLATIQKWMGTQANEKPEVGWSFSTRQHEKFARGFEQYLREGVAPSPQLAGVFAKFKDWLVKIYETLKGLGSPISEDIRGVFDRMLASEPQRTVIAPEKATKQSRAETHEADAQHAAPHEAEPHGDRVVAERNDHYEVLPEDIRREHETAIAETARLEAEGVQPGGGALDVAGEAGPDSGGRGKVVGAGAQPELEPTGGAGGAQHGTEQQGGDATVRQSPDVSGTQQRPGGGEKSESIPLAPTPAANFSVADQTKWISKEGNIRVENITSVPEFKAAIDEASRRTGQQGSGTVTMGEMLDLAEISGIDPAKVTETQLANMFGGVQGLASKIWALRTAVKDSAQIVSQAMRAVRDDASDANAAAFALALSRHDMLQSTLSGVTAETGRGLGMGFRKMEGWEKAQDLNEFMKANTGRTLFQLKQMAKLGSVLDTPAQVSKFVADAQKRTFGKMVLEYWINGLLSGPATHSTNTIGNLILTLQHAVPETAAAAAIGRIRTMLGREGETVRIGEIGARFKGLKESLPSALQATGESFKSSTTVLLPGEEARPLPYQTHADLAPHPAMPEGLTYNEVMTNAFGAVQGLRDATIATAELIKAGGVEQAPLVGTRYALTGSIPDIEVKGVNVLPLGTIARLPGRFLSAADSFFRVANYSMAKNAIAYRTASEEGHVGNAFDARVAEIRDNPTEAMMSKMVEEATELTLQAKGGKLLQALQHLAGVEIAGFPVLKFVTPFVHVAGNIMKQTLVQRTPFGMFSAEIRADLAGKNGNVAADMAMARMLFGTTLSVTLGTLAAQGYASGSGPTDPNEAAMWRLAGNQAHSVRIGDMWYGVQKLGPLGLLMGLSADLYDVAHSASEGEMTEAAAHLVHAVSQNVLDQSMMKGPAELLRAIQDSDRYGEAYVRNFLSGFVPFSVGMAQMARIGDPYSRQTRTIIDAIRNKIPGHLDALFEQGLFPKRDIWGEEMQAPEALGGRGVTGITQTKLSTDPVNVAMLDLGLNPAKVERTIRNVDLTEQQYDDYARIAGRMTKMRLDVIVKSGAFQTWPNHVKHDVMQETIKQSREAARGMMLMKFPQIVRDAVALKMEKFKD